MAVQQARHHLSHAFPHDLHAFSRAMDDVGVVPGAAFLDEYGFSAPAPGLGGAAAVLGDDFPRSEMTRNYGFEPRKRPRVTAEGSLEDRSAVLLRPAVAHQELVAAVPVGNGQGRAAGSGTASTSGRSAANVAAAVSQPQGLLSRLCYHQDAEIDALLTLEGERMRAVLEEARRGHARALLAAVERAASGRLRAAEAELERALRRNAELEEKARQMVAECQAWMGVAQSHEAVAAGLRATLDQLLMQSPSCAAAVAIGGACEGDAEDAQSCCFEAPAASRTAASSSSSSSWCRACGGEDASVLLLPCRHLCLCLSCEPGVDACPVCAAAKNASLHVLLS